MTLSNNHQNIKKKEIKLNLIIPSVIQIVIIVIVLVLGRTRSSHDRRRFGVVRMRNSILRTGLLLYFAGRNPPNVVLRPSFSRRGTTAVSVIDATTAFRTAGSYGQRQGEDPGGGQTLRIRPRGGHTAAHSQLGRRYPPGDA